MLIYSPFTVYSITAFVITLSPTTIPFWLNDFLAFYEVTIINSGIEFPGLYVGIVTTWKLSRIAEWYQD